MIYQKSHTLKILGKKQNNINKHSHPKAWYKKDYKKKHKDAFPETDFSIRKLSMTQHDIPLNIYKIQD